MSNTEENRFHALKFAAQTLGAAHPGDVIQAANLYLDFLEGRLATTAEQAEAEAQELAKDVELADLTESYPADEPVIAMADSPMSEEEILDELFGAEPDKPLPEGPLSYVNPHIDELREAINAGPADEPVTATEMRAYIDALEAEVPTEAEITAAVEQIADPAPVTEDASEQPEMTDEQVEAKEDHWREAADAIDAAEHEPEKELEPVGAHMRFAPWFATRK